MGEISKKRRGEFMLEVMKFLYDAPEGLPVNSIMDHIRDTFELTEFETGFYDSNSYSPRFVYIIRFSTIGLTKAGWLVKTKGTWILTDEGRQAYKKYTDPNKLFEEISRAYRDWKKTQLVKEEEIETIDDQPSLVSLTYEEAEEKSTQQIKEYLSSIQPYAFQDLIADLLNAMGYYVTWVAPPGKDHGVDIIAYTDPLGTQNPRIKVQVKHRDSATNVDALRSFLAVLGSNDVGLFVSTGGFTSDARDLARTQENRRITLLDVDDLIDNWIEHYDKLSQDAKQRFPLKPIYFLSPED